MLKPCEIVDTDLQLLISTGQSWFSQNMAEKVMINEFLNSNYLPISKMLNVYTEVIDISIELS